MKFGNIVTINHGKFTGTIVGFKTYMTMDGNTKDRVCVRVIAGNKVFDKWVKRENVEVLS